MSRYLTHVKCLQDPAEPAARFLERARGLGHKRGPFCSSSRRAWRPTRRPCAAGAARAGGGRVPPRLLVQRRDPPDPRRPRGGLVPRRQPEPPDTLPADGGLGLRAVPRRVRLARPLLRGGPPRLVGGPASGGVGAARPGVRLLQQRRAGLRPPRRGDLRPALPGAGPRRGPCRRTGGDPRGMGLGASIVRAGHGRASTRSRGLRIRDVPKPGGTLYRLPCLLPRRQRTFISLGWYETTRARGCA